MRIRGLYLKHGVWWFQAPQVGGVRPKPVSLGTKDRAEALRRFEGLHRAAGRDFRKGKLRLEIARYLQAQSEGRHHAAASTREGERMLGKLADFLGPGTAVDQVGTDDLRRWQRTFEECGLAAASMRSYFGRVSGFFSWAVREGLISENPVRGLQLPRAAKTRAERYCTKEERERIVEAAGRIDLALICWLGFFAGLRIGEIVEARRGWVDLAGGVLTVQNTETFTTKDKAHRTIRLSGRLGGFLGGYLDGWAGLRGAGDRDYLLRPDKAAGRKIRRRLAGGAKTRAWRLRYDPRRPFGELVGGLGLGWVTPHTMRHTFATLHALAGTPLTTIAREMGDDPETTFRNYVGYTRGGAHADATD